MNEKDCEFLKRKNELGYYGQFYDMQTKIPLLAFHILQKEVGNELIMFSKNNFKPKDTIKFKDSVEKYHFQFASNNFSGKKFREFLDFFKEISNTNYNAFWSCVANDETYNVTAYLESISNQIKISKQRFTGLSNCDFKTKFLSKILGYDIKSLQNEISDLSDIYVGISELLTIWTSMTKEEQINYVAKRYLSTGNLNFDSESANKYSLNYIRNNVFLKNDDNSNELSQ